MWLTRPLGWLLCSLLVLTLAGCQSAIMEKLPANDFEEQLYINAELNFAIKHPLNWIREITPVSSPAFKGDTVHWRIGDPADQKTTPGNMRVQSIPTPKFSLTDQLSRFLSDKPALQSGQTSPFDHSAGEALKYSQQETHTCHLIFVIKGKQRDFIISLDYPKESCDKLLPIFNEVVDSFSEILRPASERKTHKP